MVSSSSAGIVILGNFVVAHMVYVLVGHCHCSHSMFVNGLLRVSQKKRAATNGAPSYKFCFEEGCNFYTTFSYHLPKTGVMLTGLISKAVKTYFDRKAVKTRLKPVKTGLNRSKHGQNLKLRNTCQGLWKNPIRWMYVYPSVYGLCIWNAENWI